jgi:hypothetical protein
MQATCNVEDTKSNEMGVEDTKSNARCVLSRALKEMSLLGRSQGHYTEGSHTVLGDGKTTAWIRDQVRLESPRATLRVKYMHKSIATGLRAKTRGQS